MFARRIESDADRLGRLKVMQAAGLRASSSGCERRVTVLRKLLMLSPKSIKMRRFVCCTAVC